MTEVFFILVVAYAAYVLHTTLSAKQPNEHKSNDNEETGQIKTEVVKTTTTTVTKPPSAVSAKPEKPSKAKVTARKTANKPIAKVKLPVGNLRNPATGEEAKIANSYRMTKRWIKEALVEEGLLEKIYKVNELNDEINVKISQALTELLTMEKYAVVDNK